MDTPMTANSKFMHIIPIILSCSILSFLFGCGHYFSVTGRIVRSSEPDRSYFMQYQDGIPADAGMAIENAYVLWIPEYHNNSFRINETRSLYRSEMIRTTASGCFTFEWDNALDYETRHIIVRKNSYDQFDMSYKYSFGKPLPERYEYLIALKSSLDNNASCNENAAYIKTEKGEIIDVNLYFRYHHILNIFDALVGYAHIQDKMLFNVKGSDAALMSLVEGKNSIGDWGDIIKTDDLIRDCSAVKETTGVDYLYLNPEDAKDLEYNTILLVEKDFFYGDRSLFAVSMRGDIFYLENSQWTPAELIGKEYNKLGLSPFIKARIRNIWIPP
jgi:hypothetical protein